MSHDFDHDKWLNNQLGTIPKGTFCDACARFNSRPTAVNCILIKDNKVLLVKRAEEPGLGDWDIPGGYLDWDETLEEGAIRELKEETNLDVKVADLKFFKYFSNPDNSEGNQVIEMYFVTKKYTGEIKLQESEASDFGWFDLIDLPDNVAFDHAEALLALDSKKP